MLEFGVEVSTDELVALERALRGLDTPAARAAIAKAHHAAAALTADEREAVLSALRTVLGDAPGSAAETRRGLPLLVPKLELEQETEDAEPPPKPARSKKT
jgi:hypothetical protein